MGGRGASRIHRINKQPRTGQHIHRAVAEIARADIGRDYNHDKDTVRVIRSSIPGRWSYWAGFDLDASECVFDAGAVSALRLAPKGKALISSVLTQRSEDSKASTKIICVALRQGVFWLRIVSVIFVPMS